MKAKIWKKIRGNESITAETNERYNVEEVTFSDQMTPLRPNIPQAAVRVVHAIVTRYTTQNNPSNSSK